MEQTDDPRVSDDFPVPPDGSRIDVVEANTDRLVIHIPGGGQHTARLGWSALGLICVMCYVSLPSTIDQKEWLVLTINEFLQSVDSG